MLVDIPAAQGVDIYVFCGGDMKDAVSRYNLFSGGGALPPMWGIGCHVPRRLACGSGGCPAVSPANQGR
ncbi:hypothetical protein ACFTAO_40490 [Paenibacillus rhizoplanae]